MSSDLTFITNEPGKSLRARFGVLLGDDTRYKLPIAMATPVQQSPIIKLVDEILTAKKREPKADTMALEQEIDRLVYVLYELTPEEIAIVEGSQKRR